MSRLCLGHSISHRVCLVLAMTVLYPNLVSLYILLKHLYTTSCARPQGGSQGGFAATHAALPRQKATTGLASGKPGARKAPRRVAKPRGTWPRPRRMAVAAGGPRGGPWHVPTTINIEIHLTSFHMFVHPQLQTQLKEILDSNPDFQINLDPDVCRICPKMLRMHYLVGDSYTNQPLIV